MLKKIRRLGTYEVIAFLGLLVIGVGFWTQALSATSAAPLILSSFLSTFCGASYAFQLNVNREASKKREDQRASLQLALFTMARQYNALVNLALAVNGWQKRGDRAINMPALQLPPYEDLKLNFEGLTFLLETSEPMLLLELTVEQERFVQTMTAADTRNKFHVDEVQPAIETSKVNKKSMTLNEMQTALGERVFGTIENQTAELFNHLSLTLKSLPIVAKKIFDLAKTEFPDEKFVKVQFLTLDEIEKKS